MVRGGRKVGSEFRNLPSRARHYAISISTPLSLNRLEVVGLSRFELLTPRLSSVCSNQLSYRPGLLGLAWAVKELGLLTPGPPRIAGSLKTRQSAFHKNRSRSCYQIDLLEINL